MSFYVDKFSVMARRLGFSEWVLWFGVGGWGLYDLLARGRLFGGLCAVLFLGAGLLQLFAHRRAWHVGLAAWLVFTGFVALFGFSSGLSTWRIVGLLMLSFGAWTHYKDRPRYLALTREASGEADEDTGDGERGEGEDEDGPKHSIVLLLREALYLDATMLERMASRAYGLRFDGGEDAEHFIVGGENTPFVMRVEGSMFLIHHWARPYFDDPENVADGFRELRRATAIRAHRAWFSVDLLKAAKGWGEERIHDRIGRLLAEVPAAGGEILAVCHPATRRLVPWDPELPGKLGGGDPLSVFHSEQVPVIRVDADSAAMAAAVEEARRRWPEFLAAYQTASDKEPFAVKAPVAEGGNTEFIWINVKAIAGDQIHGLLANDPVALGDLKLGSFVTVSASDINDWACPDPASPDRPLGLFTVKVVCESGRD